MSVQELIAKHTTEGRDRYAAHRNAESEAWKAWYRSGANPEHRDPAFAYMAVTIAEQYHNPRLAA